MEIRRHEATDTDSADVGAGVFTAMLEAFREIGSPTPPTPTPEMFTAIWAAKMALVLGAWENGLMVACRVTLISPHLFDAKRKVASTVALFVAPAVRGHGIAKRLMEAGDTVLREMGVESFTVPAAGSGIPSQSAGYRPTMTTWEKSL